MVKASRSECAIVAGMFGGAVGMCIMASNAWHWVGGFALWGAAEAVRCRRQMEYAEVFQGAVEYSQEVLGDVGQVAIPVSRHIEKEKIRIMAEALRQMPLGDRLAESFIAKQGLDTEWFNGFEKRSAVVCGESKDGKSFLLNWRVQRFLESHPDGEIFICDPDYGSSHEGAEPNTWLGLPVGRVVQLDEIDIYSTILYVSEEVSRRAKATAAAIQSGNSKPKYRPLLLVCDEWVNFWSSLNDGQKEDVLKALTNIINRGIKQDGVTFILGIHDLSVGSNVGGSGLPTALLNKLEVLLLYRASQNTLNYRNLAAQPGQVDEALKRMAALPRTIRDRRPVVVFTDKQLAVKALPHLDVKAIELIEPEEPIDPIQQWLNEIWSDELESKLSKRIAQRISEGKQPISLTECWKMAGQIQRDQRQDNPRYLAFKNRINSLLVEIQKSADPGGGKNSAVSPIAAESTEQGLERSPENADSASAVGTSN